MFVPRRRPLMRAAMMGGAGYMAGKRAARSNYREQDQEQRLSELEQQQYGGQPQAAAPAPVAAPAEAPAPAGGDLVSRLNELKGLLDAGALTQQEFDAAKAKVLAGA
ncbi:SHOCT domain-containing protein [Conexibacter sp. JD483]|uniref:SHOCT domain-containing protein n=1 Tax=unclassified Conexibacter TaxID=2627773 RepID=UPI002722A3D5|nr:MULTISPECIES: SHOCT domain-containing protein [unclassified Conexibacter]MDO8186997.1 SHOCT domain-containing protein [Conexibacter sp. CPCC 205706]MDO8200685.1 SHOCT domain-containing protein [Conexibacter sp. CPCC 205762]MDR9371490.1 SHOCT domain-containing protein [Conexibacter sp. JD483]